MYSATTDLANTLYTNAVETVSPTMQLTPDDIPNVDGAELAEHLDSHRDGALRMMDPCIISEAGESFSSAGPGGWYLSVDGGESCRVYSRDTEEERNGQLTTRQETIVCFLVPGVTMLEFCEYFNSHHVWDSDVNGAPVTLEKPKGAPGVDIRYTTYNSLIPGMWGRDTVQAARFEMLPDGRIYFHSVSINHKLAAQSETTKQFVRANVSVDAIIAAKELDGKSGRGCTGVEVFYKIEIDPGGVAPLQIVRSLSKLAFPRAFSALAEGCAAHFAGKPLANETPPSGPIDVPMIAAD